MADWIAYRWLTERRRISFRVRADSAEDAARLVDAGEGHTMIPTGEFEVIEWEPVDKVVADPERGATW